MSDIELPSSGTLYVYVPVDTTADVTGATAEVAFTLDGFEPAEADWVVAEWIGTTQVRLLVGPDGGLTLPPGRYRPWVRVTAAPEIPVRPARNWIVVY